MSLLQILPDLIHDLLFSLPFIQIAWALNKGIKPELKKLWDVERGVTYIPWEKVKVASLEGYREGGMLDAETLCPGKDWC